MEATRARPEEPSRGIFVQSMDAAARARLLSKGHRRHFPRRSVIYRKGEEALSLFVVETGRVEISVTDAEGRVSILNVMGPGDVIGEIALLDQGQRSADVISASEVTGVLIEKAAILRFLEDEPHAAFAMIAELCAKVRNASEMFETRSKLSGPARLAECLLRMADRWGEALEDGGHVVLTEVSQGVLGDYARLSRENVNRIIRGWSAEGIVAVDPDGRRMSILDRDRLTELAG